MFEKVWREYEPNTPLFEDQSTFTEWVEGSNKMMGMKRPNGDKHGVVRFMDSYKYVHYCTYKENELHGLYLRYYDRGYLEYCLYQNGTKLEFITWYSNWSVYEHCNEDKLDQFFTVNDFRQ